MGDWDDRAKIDDPEDAKPEDWEQPEHVSDPDAKKPDDWDDDMDGEWEPPMIDNPDYKGEWKNRLTTQLTRESGNTQRLITLTTAQMRNYTSSREHLLVSLLIYGR